VSWQNHYAKPAFMGSALKSKKLHGFRHELNVIFLLFISQADNIANISARFGVSNRSYENPRDVSK
jgi:hypothetical protein